MKNKIFLPFIVLIFSSFCHLIGQEKDMQTWFTLGISIPVHNKIHFEFENESRFINKTSLFGRNQAEFAFVYTQNQQWSYGLGYRLKTQYPFSDYSTTDHRWLADIMWKTRTKRLRINTRLRLLNDQESFIGEPLDEMVHREKIRVAYKIRKTPFLVYCAAETYFPLQASKLFTLQKLRFTAGSRYQINNTSRVTFDFIYDREFNRSINSAAFVFQFGYSFDLGKISD
jgi:hypothetical protein